MQGRCVALLLAGICLGCGSRPTAQFELGQQRFQAHEYREAAGHFSEVIKQEPRNVEAYEARGRTWVASGDFAQAADDFATVLSLAPDHLGTVKDFLKALLDAGKGVEALVRLPDLETKLSPGDRQLFYGRARLQSGDTAEACRDLAVALELDSASFDATFYLAIAQAKLGNLADAELQLTKAIALDGAQSRAYLQRSIVRTKLKKPDLAEEDRKKAAQIDPRIVFADSSVGKNVLESLKGTSQADDALEPLAKGLGAP